MTIREMISHDWDAVMKIYKQGIDSGLSTFSTHYPSWEEWDSGHRKECRYVAACVKGAKGMNCEKCDTAMFQAKMDGGYNNLDAITMTTAEIRDQYVGIGKYSADEYRARMTL